MKDEKINPILLELIGKVDQIIFYIKGKEPIPKIDGWVDNAAVCTFLKVSQRTLQRLRSDQLINFTIIKKKAYYKLSEIERILNERLIKADPKDFQALLQNYHNYVKQIRDFNTY